MSDDLKWIGLDLDGTIFENNWSPEDPDASIGEPIWPNIEQAWSLVDAGYKLVIHTARPWSAYAGIEDALTAVELPFRAIVCGKLLALAYIDDRAISASHHSWLRAVERIRQGGGADIEPAASEPPIVERWLPQ